MTFYLFLFVPFSFFFERVFLRREDPKRGFLLRTVIYIITLCFSYFIRQDTDISLYFKCFFYGFVLLLIISTHLGSKLITPFRKFEKNLKICLDNPARFEVNVSRLSAISSAFSLGLSNTNKRRTQTCLTCITLVLLSFCVLSFTSIKSILIFKRTDIGRIRSEYSGTRGIAIRGTSGHYMPEESYEAFLNLANSMNIEMAVARCFYQPNDLMFLEPNAEVKTLNGKFQDYIFSVDGLLGCTQTEIYMSKLQEAIIEGEWFNSDDEASVIISSNLARILGIVSEDIGEVYVILNQDTNLRVIGIYEPYILSSMRDVDGRLFLESRAGDPLILPYEKAVEMGGRPIAFFLKSDDTINMISLIEKTLESLPYMIYRMEDDRIYQYRPTRTLATEGIENLPILMIVVGLVILNTMLSSVYERQNEIAIYSSVGLSPLHIGGLFIAEAMVYAVLGCTAGYILGGFAGRVIFRFQLVPGLIMDYTSVAVMRSVMLIIGLVLLSTLYPAIAASRLSVPNIERRWKMPDKLRADANLTILLPFIFSGSEPVGILAYIKRIFENLGEKDSQCGYVYEMSTFSKNVKYGTAYTLVMNVHLAPYDLGVNQTVKLTTIPTNTSGVYHMEVELIRLTGDIPSWKRGNQAFISTLRKQCLVWRDLTQEIKKEHEDMGIELFPEFKLEKENIEQHEFIGLNRSGA